MTITTPKINYLNNRDILKEIHLSKKSFCSFIDPVRDHQYDIILPTVDKINRNTIADARKNRADRLKRETGTPVDPKKIPYDDLVFRIVCWDHIPLAPAKVAKNQPKKPKFVDILDFDVDDLEDDGLVVEVPVINPKYVRLNFAPFHHYRLDNDKKPYLVGKSHWKGDLETGEFSMTHGRITHNLATMFIKLCDRYSGRSNWRYYCVDTETEALTTRGWLNIESITEDDTILSFENDHLKWSSIKSIFRGEYDGLMHRITSRSIDALITPEHKLVTKRGLVKAEHIKQSDNIVVMGKAVEGPSEERYPNSLVELIGWIVTEGCYDYDNNDEIKNVTISQNHGTKADRIRKCLESENIKFTEKLKTDKLILFRICKFDCQRIWDLIPEKDLTMDFILGLTNQQRLLLIDTMINADGWTRRGNNKSYVQKKKASIDLFQVLVTMSGIKSNYHYVQDHISYGKPTSFYNIHLFSDRGNSTRGECLNFHGGLNNGAGFNRALGKETFPNHPTTPYSGMIWCPETEYGCFVARRNGKVYLTGNTYNDEMRGQALLQLSQVGLQFDESKSQNPFSYYTCCVTNSFTRILNAEKKNQNIRDDILTANGLNPSWTRQNLGKFEALSNTFYGENGDH